ncbi:MerR family transcriptional regulator [Nonomuraea roseoviolacea subsp. roseoviolacea]|uniref:MerR family transcriptional regulator n=1 Tax=Nonomuraea roseoviolacea TaxID=103837 RepID=UPI0031DB3136
MSGMKIGDLSRETGVSPRLLRYYEEQGLLEAERDGGGQRHYGPVAPVVVRRIRTLLDAGLPTRVIRQVLPCVEGDDRLAACTLQHLRGRLTGLEEQLAGLQATRDALAGLVAAVERTSRPLISVG